MPLSELERRARQLAGELATTPERVFEILRRVPAFDRTPPRFRALASPFPDPGDRPDFFYDRGRHLQKAAEALGAAKALDLFESEDLDALWERVYLTDELTNRSQALHTLDETAGLLGRLGQHLENCRSRLLQTGFPYRVFRESIWHDIRLTNHYFTKLPLKLGLGGGPEAPVHRLFWPRNPVNQMRVLRPGEPFTFKIPIGGYWTRDGDEEYDEREQDELFKVAPVITGLRQEQAERLVAIRAKWLDLKIGVTNGIAMLAASGHRDEIWSRSVELLAGGLSAEEAAFLLDADAFYLCFDLRSGKWRDGYAPPMPSGGLSELLMVVGHHQKEGEFESLHKAAREVRKLPQPVKDLSYYQILAEPWAKDWEAILEGYAESLGDESIFWEEFPTTIAAALSQQFKIPLAIEVGLVDPKIAADMKATLTWAIQTYVRHFEVFGRPPAISIDHEPAPTVVRAGKKRSARKIATPETFPTPPGASWGEVRITQRGDSEVSIRLRDQTGIYNFTQMGLVDRRTGRGNSLWTLLLAFAKENGTITWKSSSAHRKLQKQREDLGKVLRCFFMIEGDPIEYLKDVKGWKTRFQITPSK